jgi:hypothetical protein
MGAIQASRNHPTKGVRAFAGRPVAEMPPVDRGRQLGPTELSWGPTNQRAGFAITANSYVIEIAL